MLRDPFRAAAAVPRIVARTHVADGLWIDRAGRFFVSNPGEDSIEVADRPWFKQGVKIIASAIFRIVNAEK